MFGTYALITAYRCPHMTRFSLSSAGLASSLVGAPPLHR